jgi:hypothetical protein
MTMSELRQDPDSSKQSELVVMHQPTSEGREGTGKFRSSLISQGTTVGNDTVYSYLEEESGISRESIPHGRGDLRKSLRVTKHSLTRAKQLLKREQKVNRH